MKAVVIRNLNEIVSLTVLALMAVALIAGQVNPIGDVVASNDFNLHVTSFRHNGE